MLMGNCVAVLEPDSAEAEKGVRSAWMNGIHEFDTAQGYGDSEKSLGYIFENLGINSDVKVISKIDTAVNHLDANALHDSIMCSLTTIVLLALMMSSSHFFLTPVQNTSSGVP